MRRNRLFLALAFPVLLGFCAQAFGQGRTGGTSAMSGLGGLGSTGLGMGGLGSGIGGLGSGMGGGSGSGSSTGLGTTIPIITRQQGTFVGSDSMDLPRIFGGAVTSSSSTGYGSVGSRSSGRSGLGSSSGGLGSSSGGFGSSSGGFGSSFGGLGSSFGGSGSSFGRSGTSFGGLGSSSGGLGSSFGRSGSSYGGMGSSYGGMGSSYGGMGSSYGGMGSSYGRSGSSYGGMGSSYGRSGSMSGGYGSSLGRGATMGGYGMTGLGATGYNQPLPVSLNISFPFPPRPPENVSQRLSSSQLVQRGRLQSLSPVVVSVRGETAILQGAVASQHDRDLAEQMVRLEPGVAQVDNMLTVGQPAVSPSSPPPATP